MSTPHTDLTFEEWILFTFDHTVEGPVWYQAFDSDEWDGPPEVTVAYLTRLFHDPDAALVDHSDDQIGQGLWYLVGFGVGDYLRALLDPAVPLFRVMRRCYGSVSPLETALASSSRRLRCSSRT